MRRPLAAALVVFALLGPACSPPRRTASPLELLAAQVPAWVAGRGTHYEYYNVAAARAAGVELPVLRQETIPRVERLDHLLLAHPIVVVLGKVPPQAGLPEGVLLVDHSFGGPLFQSGRALDDPVLRDLVRALGEPGEAFLDSPLSCRIPWVARARRYGSTREPALGAWVFVYGGANAGVAAADDLRRVQEAVRRRPPPGEILQIDLRPRHIAVTFRTTADAELGDPISAVCGN